MQNGDDRRLERMVMLALDRGPAISLRALLALTGPLLIGYCGLAATPPAFAQPPAEREPAAEQEPQAEVPSRVDVEPLADDQAIDDRLTRILEATEWFEAPNVRVDEGVVFLNGRTDEDEYRTWAGTLARNTADVVAVVNRIEVRERSMWDLTPAWAQLRELGRAALRGVPIFLVALLLLGITWMAARGSMQAAGTILRRRFQSELLSNVAARVAAVPVFLLGLYVVLSISGLGSLAVTVVGGTGLLGLAIGFAFRDIAENFLASVLLSTQRPFATGDLIEVKGFRGFVQSVNTRSTLLMTLEGNHVQIPNATMYKETITNFTANPIARYDFTVGIGYEESIARAQSVALEVLRDHPAVIDDPEPLVLVEALGPATVSLRIYLWVNIAKYSHLKVRSAVIRLIKRAFLDAGISMPDEAREVVFPDGIPLRRVEDAEGHAAPARKPAAKPAVEPGATANTAEDDLTSEAPDIERQARRSRAPEGGENLLE